MNSCKTISNGIKFGVIFPLVLVASLAIVRKELRSSHRQPPSPESTTNLPPVLEAPLDLSELEPIGTDAAVVVSEPVAPQPPPKPEPPQPEPKKEVVTTSESPATTGEAEVVSDSSIATIDNGNTLGTDDTQPVLGKDTPEWITKGLVLGESLRTPLASSLFLTVEECRKDLESRIFEEAKAKVATYALRWSVSIDDIPEITREYVLENWVTKNREFDNVQVRPSGTYHQLWCELNLSQEEIKKVQDWARPILAEHRTKEAGAFAAFAIVTMGFVSGLVGLLAGREKAKLKK